MQAGNFFDVIVIGVGSMGASACYYLAAGGAKVLGIEQFKMPHDQGSHAGQSRIIRQAYFEHPDYVPLLQKAYENWEHLEQISGDEVFIRTGLLYAGPAGHSLMQGVRLSADTYGIPLDVLNKAECKASFQAMEVPETYECLFERNAGFVTPERSIRLYAAKAQESGAVILTETRVNQWRENGNTFEVNTSAGIFRAKKLVITAGAWASKVMPALKVPLHVTKQVLAWVQPRKVEVVSLGNFPCWMVVDDAFPGVFYGFPMLHTARFEGPAGFKLAWHYPGTPCNPDEDDRSAPEADELHLRSFLDKYFPGLYGSTNQIKTCLYTNSPDEHFIIDYLPEYEGRVAVAAGFSGHGFKFASVIGEILSDMILNGGTALPVGFLGLERFRENLF
jgi:sarcosine oxidase